METMKHTVDDAVMVPVEPVSASVFAPVAVSGFEGESLYMQARKTAVQAHADNRRNAGGVYSPYSVVDSDGTLNRSLSPVEDELFGSPDREAWLVPLAYVHGGLPVSARSVSAGSGFNEQGIWERSSVARVVQHVPAPVVSVSGGQIFEMPTGVMCRRILTFIASRVVETDSVEFAIPSQPRALARLLGMPALSAEGSRRLLDMFRICLGLSTAVFDRTDGARGDLTHAFSVAADVSDPTMGVQFSLEGNTTGSTRVRVSNEFYEYVTGGNVIAVPSTMWNNKLIRSSAVAVDVLAMVLARAATLRAGAKGSKVWVAWSHLARQFSVFTASVHRARTTYRDAVQAVRTVFMLEGAEDVVSLVGKNARKGFAGFVISPYRSAVKTIKAKAQAVNATISTGVRGAIQRATLNESAVSGAPITIPARLPRTGNIYRAVDINLLSAQVKGLTGVHLPVISDEWERIIDTVVNRYTESARLGNLKPVDNWQAYVKTAIANQPALLNTPKPVKPARALQGNNNAQATTTPDTNNKSITAAHIATDGLPTREATTVPKTENAKRKDTDLGAPSSAHVATVYPTLIREKKSTFNLLDPEFLKKYMDADCIITLPEGSQAHYDYADALQYGAVPVNNYNDWKKGKKLPPVRIKLPSGQYIYLNNSSHYTRGDDYYCRVLLTQDYKKEIMNTIRQMRGEPAPTKTVRPAPVETTPVATPKPAVTRYVPATETYDGYAANYDELPTEAVVLDELPEPANAEEAEARAAIIRSLGL